MEYEQEIELNEDFQKTIKILSETKDNVFITGKAGTGKTTFLKYFISQYCKPKKKKFVVLAPTGVAALNAGGETIHHFFKFKTDITPDKIVKPIKSVIYKNLELVIIDEASMLRADLLDCVDRFLRLNGPVPDTAFGGVQILFIGDLLQLSPVVKKEEADIFKLHYDTPYFLSAKCMENSFCHMAEFQKVYRQTDEKFISVLNSIRENTADDEILALLNKTTEKTFKQDNLPVLLTSTNKLAEFYNNKFLNMIDGMEYTFNAETENIENLSVFPAAYELKLKAGAQIMMLNNDSNKRWVNGTMGTIEDIAKVPGSDNKCLIYVKLQNGKTEVVDQHKWELTRYKWNQKAKTIETEKIGSFSQYPLKLAWAVTIHKSQGKTFDNVMIDLGYSGAFAPGQLYVALSRCRELDGIALKNEITKDDIIVDKRVAELFEKRKEINKWLKTTED